MPSSSFVLRNVAVGLSTLGLLACTSALGNFTIDDSLDGGGAASDGGGSVGDGSTTVDGAGGDAGGSTLTDCNNKSPFSYVFTTSVTFPGTLSVNGLHGIQAANQHCNDVAKGKMPGTYAAWISLGNGQGQSPISLVTKPLFLRDCTPVLTSAASYKQNKALQHAINLDESGNPVTGAVWTGTRADGTSAGQDATCADWTVSNQNRNATVGSASASDETWTNKESVACDTTAHLYCVQTGP
jgi:hypothetical protein